jgi:hypothetical protein
VPLGRFFLLYLYALVATVAAKLLFFQLDIWIGIVGWVITHLYAGYRLNRAILPYFDWNPMTNAIGPIARAKLSALVFWPVTYAVFIVQLWAIRYL